MLPSNKNMQPRSHSLPSQHYTDRLADVERTHAEDPRKLAYQVLQPPPGYLPSFFVSVEGESAPLSHPACRPQLAALAGCAGSAAGEPNPLINPRPAPLLATRPCLSQQNLDLRYSALAGGVNSFTRADAGVGQLDACHMRDKTLGEQAWWVRGGGRGWREVTAPCACCQCRVALARSMHSVMGADPHVPQACPSLNLQWRFAAHIPPPCRCRCPPQARHAQGGLLRLHAGLHLHPHPGHLLHLCLLLRGAARVRRRRQVRPWVGWHVRRHPIVLE